MQNENLDLPQTLKKQNIKILSQILGIAKRFWFCIKLVTYSMSFPVEVTAYFMSTPNQTKPYFMDLGQKDQYTGTAF